MTMIIHGMSRSPRVRAALLGLEECGAPYRLAAMAMGDVANPEHVARHPFARVPVLEDGDFKLFETQAILRYLARRFPAAGLVPGDVRRAARMDQIMGISDSYFFDGVTIAIARNRLVAAMRGTAPDEERVAAAVPLAQKCFATFEMLMEGGPYLAGPALSLADLLLVPEFIVLAKTPEGEVLLAAHPRLAAWLELMRARPSFAATEPERLAKAA